MGLGRSLPVTTGVADIFQIGKEPRSTMESKNGSDLGDKSKHDTDNKPLQNGCIALRFDKEDNFGTEKWKVQNNRLWILPVLSTILPIVTCLSSYSIAVALDHVDMTFPSISMVGTKPPESCIFGLLLNIFSLTAGGTMYIRYKHISLCYFKDHCRFLSHFNKLTFAVGIIALVGAIVVAHFQVENVEVVHYMGSFSLFSFGMLYFMFQTILSFICTEMPGNRLYIRISRLMISVLHLVLFTLFWTYWLMHPDPEMYVKATITEWVLAFVLVAYSMTFIPEFVFIKTRVDMSIPSLSRDSDYKSDYFKNNNDEKIQHIVHF